jgi:hypothetical protein
MPERVIHEVRFIETDDGFRIEVKGDKERMREMGFGPGMMGLGHGMMGHGRHHRHRHGGRGHGPQFARPFGWWWGPWWDEEDEGEAPHEGGLHGEPPTKK